MLFAWDITVATGTAEASPKSEILKCTAGIITRIELKFPAGCHGLVKVKILRSEFRIVPLSDFGWITGDDETVGSNMYFSLQDIPTELKFVACSPGTTCPHTITVRVTILPEKVASQLPLMDRLGKILKYFGGGE
jgi:hypothetical protein